MLLEKIVRCTEILKSKKQTVAFVEGASNGTICDAFASFASAESVLLGGMVAFKDHMKTYFFGIEEATLERYGSESAYVASLMAQNLPDYLDADICISITGATDVNQNDEQLNPIFIHIQFSDAQITEEFIVDCNEKSIIEQTLARICKHIKHKLSRERVNEFEMA